MGIHGAVSKTFDERKGELVRLAAVYAPDYPNEFSIKVSAITGMTGGEVDRKICNSNDEWEFTGATKLLTRLQDLIAFVGLA